VVIDELITARKKEILDKGASSSVDEEDEEEDCSVYNNKEEVEAVALFDEQNVEDNEVAFRSLFVEQEAEV
jgi:hypothetical protein